MSNFKHKFSIFSLVATSLVLISSNLYAGFYDSAMGTKHSSLLNGRLSILAPSTLRREEITIDLQSEKNLFKDQTVLEYNKNGKQLRIVATELFARRTGNLQGNLAKLIYSYPQKVGLQYKIAQLDRHRYELIPSKLILVKGIALIRTLFFVNRDGTLQSIDIFMNASATSRPLKSIRLAKKLLSTIKSGESKLRKGPGTVYLGSKQKPHFFKIRLPKGFVISSKKQNNARIHIIRKLVPLGKPQVSLAIYIGNKPSPYHSHFGDYDFSQHTINSKLLGKLINWHKLKKAASLKRRMVKASRQLPWSNKNVSGRKYYIHVFADSESSKGMKQMVRLAGKLKFVSKPQYAFAKTNRQDPRQRMPSRNRNSDPFRPGRPANRSNSNREFFESQPSKTHNNGLNEGNNGLYERNNDYSNRDLSNRDTRNDYPQDPYDGYSDNEDSYPNYNNGHNHDHHQNDQYPLDSYGNEF